MLVSYFAGEDVHINIIKDFWTVEKLKLFGNILQDQGIREHRSLELLFEVIRLDLVSTQFLSTYETMILYDTIMTWQHEITLFLHEIGILRMRLRRSASVGNDLEYICMRVRMKSDMPEVPRWRTNCFMRVYLISVPSEPRLAYVPSSVYSLPQS